jgi:hypothetical protein
VSTAGRPSKFTPEARKTILKALAQGNTRKTAAELAGVDKTNLIRWINRGKSKAEKDAEFREFRTQVRLAEAKAVSAAVRTIRAFGRKNWNAFAWWLSKKEPDEWGEQKDLLLQLKKQLVKQSKKIDASTPAWRCWGTFAIAAPAQRERHWGRVHSPAVFTIATMPRRTASGSVCQASMTACKFRATPVGRGSPYTKRTA